MFSFCHGLGGEVDQQVGLLGQRRLRLGRQHDNAPTSLAGDPCQCLDIREVARPTTDQEKIARSDGRRSHITHHGHIETQVHKSHGKTTHDQALSPETIDDNAASTRDRVAQPIDFSLTNPTQHSVDFRHYLPSYLVGRHPSLLYQAQ